MKEKKVENQTNRLIKKKKEREKGKGSEQKKLYKNLKVEEEKYSTPHYRNQIFRCDSNYK